MRAFAQLKALQALDAAGLDTDVVLEAAPSVTNEVWMTPDVVVRVNRRIDGRLYREAMLAECLPAELGYPGVVAYGGEAGADWLIVRRVPGRVLSRCWPTMGHDERRAAISQLAARLRVLHATPAPAGLTTVDNPQLLCAGGLSPVVPLLVAVDRAAALPNVDRSLMVAVENLVHQWAPALGAFDDTTLIHGDLTFENMLWDGTTLTLLDYEYARPAPSDLDLDVLLRCCAFPFLHVAPDYEDQVSPADYAEVPWWLAQDYPELFGRPQALERVTLYSVAYDVRELLAFPPPQRAAKLSPYHPLNRLASTVSGDGHLRRLSRTPAGA